MSDPATRGIYTVHSFDSDKCVYVAGGGPRAWGRWPVDGKAERLVEVGLALIHTSEPTRPY